MREIKNLKIKHFKILQEKFKIKTIIFTGSIPRNILNHIDKGKNLIFYTCRKQYDGLPLLRPKFKSHSKVNLTINGKLPSVIIILI